MASAIQVLLDDNRNLVVKATGSVATTNEIIVNLASMVPISTRCRIMRVIVNLDAAVTSAQLLWEATANVTAVVLSNAASDMDFNRFGGLTNNGGAGVTGNILLTTVGAGNYSVVIEMFKAGSIALQ